MARLIACAMACSLLLQGAGSTLAAQATPTAESGTVTSCSNTTRGYTLKICLTTPDPGTPIRSDPTISATVEIDNPDIRVRSVAFSLDKRQILSDFDIPYAFVLPASEYVDGEHSISVVARTSDDEKSNPTAGTILLSTGVTEAPVTTDTFVPATGRPAVAGEPFVVAAVGDSAGGSPQSAAVADLIGGWNPNLFLYLGDVYNAGTYPEFLNWYDPEHLFGQFREITLPTIGNHEYSGNDQPRGYMRYWGNPPHYYSTEINGWQFISLDTNTPFGETVPGSAQMTWLENELATSPSSCRVVFFHQPRFSVGSHGDTKELDAMWRLFTQYHVTLVLNGHDHDYQRWQPLNGDGQVDPLGTTSLIVGSGGQSEYETSRDDPRLAAPVLQMPGALRMELNQDGASLQYVTTDGMIRDSDTVQCHPNQPDTSAPTAPANVSAVQSPDGSVAVRWDPARDGVAVAVYEVERDGEVLATAPGTTARIPVPRSASAPGKIVVTAIDEAGNRSPPSTPATATGAHDPSVLLDETFASGSLDRWSSINGLTIENSTEGVDGSTWVARGRGSNSVAAAQMPIDAKVIADHGLSIAIEFQVIDQGDNPVTLLRLRDTDGVSLFGISISGDHTLGLYNDAVRAGLPSKTVVDHGAWHLLNVQLTWQEHAYAVSISLDGRPVDALNTSLDPGSAVPGSIQLGDSSPNRVYDILYRHVQLSLALPPGTPAASGLFPSRSLFALSATR